MGWKFRKWKAPVWSPSWIKSTSLVFVPSDHHHAPLLCFLCPNSGFLQHQNPDHVAQKPSTVRKCPKEIRAEKVWLFVRTWWKNTCSSSWTLWCIKIAAFQLGTDQKEGVSAINPLGAVSNEGTFCPESSSKYREKTERKFRSSACGLKTLHTQEEIF